ncbi:MAG: DHH family phosphoesterase [Haliea sp.]|nr:DHH family phosphoesterase [Haliea sp.]
MNYDVFNGDADGLCALVQLRRAEPCDATLVTGVKRDIALLEQVYAESGDSVTVLDISLDKNRASLQRLLAAGASVFYCDHHFSGDIPVSPQLEALINTSADVCTSLLVNGHLRGAYAAWAVTGAFGDNLRDSAARLAKGLDLSASQLQSLENLGIYINYNGYGPSLRDLHFAPAELYKLLALHDDPFTFMEAERSHFERLETGYRQDMAAAAALEPLYRTPAAAVYRLPDAAWARRVSGVFGNDLANQDPARAHAVVTEREDGDYLVSVRAPLNNKTGADELCREFPTGGGRAAAAGINALPAGQLQAFIDRIAAFYA